jgi:hypothetical protein
MGRWEYWSTRSTYHRASSPSEVERDVAGGRNTHESKPGSARSRKGVSIQETSIKVCIEVLRAHNQIILSPLPVCRPLKKNWIKVSNY